jgi:putative ABC transport system permease protein
MNSIRLLETLWQDLRYAWRMLRKSPGFAVVGVLSLALGIGPNATIYSVIHAVLLRSLPYPEPERLLRVEQPRTQGAVTMAELAFWKEHSVSFLSAAGHRGTSDRMLVSGDRTEWIQTMPVTTDFFRTLGVMPALGRELQPEETRSGGPLAIVLSHALWQRVFGADPKAAGRVVTIDNANYTVVGVLPPGFWFPEPADAYVPLQFSGSAMDTGTNTEMIARLKPGVDLAQARAEMAMLSESFRSAGTDLDEFYPGLTVARYQDWLVGDVRMNLLLLFGAVGLLLLIACFNLAGLLLARLVARQKEIAIRLALGGSGSRLLRQFLIENTLLTTVGGLAGLGGAHAVLGTLVAWIPFNLPGSAPIQVDAPVLGFTLAIVLATGVAFSLAPALTAPRLELHKVLKTGGQGGETTVRQRTRGLLVIGEVALSVTLLFGAGLLMQSLYQIHSERLGFDPHGVMTFRTPATAQQRTNVVALRAFDAALLQRLGAAPGVRGVAAVSMLPLTGQSNFPTERDGHPDQSIGGMEIRMVTPAYFETMGTPIVLGRSFNSGDIAAAPHVILVSETVAHTWWGEASPLGDRVTVGRYHGRDVGGANEEPREVVGVVADTKSVYLKAPPRPTVYLPIAQTPWYDYGMNWVVRGNFSTGFADRVRQVTAEIDPRHRVDRVRSMDEIVASTTADSRFNALLFGAFAGLALVLAAIGVYGLLAFSVARRTKELGTRMALGASRNAVLKLVLRQGMALVVIGLVFGLAGAIAVARSLKTLLFGVHANDPVSLIGVAALMLCVGFLASYLPARRATKVDPMVALRDE